MFVKKISFFTCFGIVVLHAFAQPQRPAVSSQARRQEIWVDSVFKSLSDSERIAQLLIIRALPNDTGVVTTANLITTYAVGGICFFQGGPLRQALQINYYQSLSKVPLLVTMDAEYGVGMRLDSVARFPYQLTLGALNDSSLVHEMGRAVGEQCRRLGVNVNYAPVVDINNNPDNPVIGFRSFGQDKKKVISYALAYMKGIQEAGVMACAKHFPGHGDVSVDSHVDLPVITKSLDALDTMELQPFKALFNAGVGSVMIAHLYIPAIDSSANTPTSLSKNSITGLLRSRLGYHGLTFTDALEMKGVSKYWPAGEAAARAFVAGNDMLCLPESVPDAIHAIRKAIDSQEVTVDDFNARVKKVLAVKFRLGLAVRKPVDTTHLVKDLNAKLDEIRYRVARETITVVKTRVDSYVGSPRVACVVIGPPSPNFFSNALKERRRADVFVFSFRDNAARADSILALLKAGRYDEVVVTVSGYSLRPANNYGITPAAQSLFSSLQQLNPKVYVFGNVLATRIFADASHLIACYQDDDITQYTAADQYLGLITAKGHLPVTIGSYQFGYSGFVAQKTPAYDKFYLVDSIVNDAIDKGAFPGCVVLAAKNGKIEYLKSFGHQQFHPATLAVKPESIYDLASVTKISATTVAVMKLFESGRIKLNATLGNYLPWTRGTDKANLKIEDVLLHQAGLVPFIQFYRETIDSVSGDPLPGIYSTVSAPGYTTRVAEGLYLRDDWQDTIRKRIITSSL
ncbi:MAG TPA: glycoside hydrolase family 3 N-terminal domain-containing protein, partial [Chitinophagaceae bacterium]